MLLENQVELPFKVPVTNCTGTGQSSQPALPSAVLTVVQGSKGYCKQMNSFEEARVFLNKFGLSRLDSDKDGEPCGAL